MICIAVPAGSGWTGPFSPPGSVGSVSKRFDFQFSVRFARSGSPPRSTTTRPQYHCTSRRADVVASRRLNCLRYARPAEAKPGKSDHPGGLRPPRPPGRARSLALARSLAGARSFRFAIIFATRESCPNHARSMPESMPE